MGLVIAEIIDADVNDVVALWQCCGLIRPWNDPIADISRARMSLTSTVLVGKESGKVVASTMVGHDGHRGWVYYVAVEPSKQSAGFGRAIMDAAGSWLKQRSIPKLQLMIRTSNASAKGFYEALGFEMQDVVVYGKWIDGRKN